MMTDPGPLCPFDFVAVEKEGYTCDMQCYSAWILHWAHLSLEEETSRFIIVPDDMDVPLTLTEQPWYLSEFPEGDRPKVIE